MLPDDTVNDTFFFAGHRIVYTMAMAVLVHFTEFWTVEPRDEQAQLHLDSLR